MIDKLAEFVKLLGWATIGVFLIAVIIAIIETSISNSRKVRDNERMREKQNEIIEKTMKEEIPRALRETIMKTMFDAIRKDD